MVHSNVTVDVTIPRRLFVFGQLRAEVSAAAFDLVYCSLSVLRFVFVLEISKQSVVVKWLSVCVQHVYCKVVIYVQ